MGLPATAAAGFGLAVGIGGTGLGADLASAGATELGFAALAGAATAAAEIGFTKAELEPA